MPAASAGPTFQDASSSGKFHGTTAPTTPSGSRSTMTTLEVGRRDLVVDLVDCLAVVRDRLGGERDVDGTRVTDRLAHVERLEQRELVGVLLDEREPLEHLLSLLRRQP